MRESRSRRVEDAPLARCVQHACHTAPCAKALKRITSPFLSALWLVISVTGKEITRLKSEPSNILQHLFNITQDMLVLLLAEVSNLAARHRESLLLAVHGIISASISAAAMS
jgi:hypothetical protein